MKSRHEKRKKEVENMLERYRSLESDIDLAKVDLQLYEDEEEIALSGVALDNPNSGKTNKISDSTSDMAIERISIRDKKIRQRRKINRLTREKIILDIALKSLSRAEREIVEERYMKKNEWYMVEKILGISESSCYRYRNKILDKLVKVLFK